VFDTISSLTSRIAEWLFRHGKSSGVGIDEAHMKYDSVKEWMIGENIPSGFTQEPDPILRDKYIQQYGELWRHLYAKHVSTLPVDDQVAIKEGRHPSQSHRYADDAAPYCEPLKDHLESLGLNVSEVAIGWYHFDRIVLAVETPEKIDFGRLEDLPSFFQGFEVKYLSTHDIEESQ